MDCVDDFQSYKMAAVDTAAANYKLYHIYLLLSREKLVLQRSFAALRMTGRAPLKAAHGKSYLQMSISPVRIRALSVFPHRLR